MCCKTYDADAKQWVAPIPCCQTFCRRCGSPDGIVQCRHCGRLLCIPCEAIEGVVSKEKHDQVRAREPERLASLEVLFTAFGVAAEEFSETLVCR